MSLPEVGVIELYTVVRYAARARPPYSRLWRRHSSKRSDIQAVGYTAETRRLN